MTHDVHYENYRSQRLAKQPVCTPSANGSGKKLVTLDDKDKQLQEKEAELKRMQEMLASMQQQIKQQSQTSLQSIPN